MGSRLHGNDGRRRRTQIVIPRDGGNTRPQIVIPATAGIHGRGRRRWVPVSTGTTAGDGAPHNRHSPRWRESTAQHRHSRAGGNPRRGAGGDGVPVSTGTTGDDGRTTQFVIPAHGGSSRLHGTPTIVIPTTARIHGHHISSFPRRRESTAGGRRRWVPVSTGTTGAPTIVIPATAGRGAPTSSFPPRRESTAPHRHSRDGGNPRRGAGGDGFPSPRERRAGGGAPTIVIPATAGIHGPTSSFPHGGNPRRGASDGFPSPRERRRTHNRHSRGDGANPRPNIVIPAQGNPRRGAGGDGFPSPRERRAHPQSSFPPRRESTAQHRHSRAGGNPRRGAGGDGFPSPRERRAGGGAPHNRHSRDGGNDGRRRVLPSSLIEWRRSGAAR